MPDFAPHTLPLALPVVLAMARDSAQAASWQPWLARQETMAQPVTWFPLQQTLALPAQEVARQQAQCPAFDALDWLIVPSPTAIAQLISHISVEALRTVQGWAVIGTQSHRLLLKALGFELGAAVSSASPTRPAILMPATDQAHAQGLLHTFTQLAHSQDWRARPPKIMLAGGVEESGALSQAAQTLHDGLQALGATLCLLSLYRRIDTRLDNPGIQSSYNRLLTSPHAWCFGSSGAVRVLRQFMQASGHPPNTLRTHMALARHAQVLNACKEAGFGQALLVSTES